MNKSNCTIFICRMTISSTIDILHIYLHIVDYKFSLVVLSIIIVPLSK